MRMPRLLWFPCSSPSLLDSALIGFAKMSAKDGIACLLKFNLLLAVLARSAMLSNQLSCPEFTTNSDLWAQEEDIARLDTQILWKAYQKISNHKYPKWPIEAPCNVKHGGDQ